MSTGESSVYSTPSKSVRDGGCAGGEDQPATTTVRKSGRKVSPLKRFEEFITTERKRRPQAVQTLSEPQPMSEDTTDDYDELEQLPSDALRPCAGDLQSLQENEMVAGRQLFGFNTPKKRGGMALAAMNTPKTPKTPKLTKANHDANTPHSKHTTATTTATPKTLDAKRHKEPKTPSRQRARLKNQIAKLVEENSESDFSADGSEFEPSDSSDLDSSSSDGDGADSSPEDAVDDEPKTPRKGRRPIVVPVLPKTPSATAAQRARQKARAKKSVEFVPQSDDYFQSHSNAKILTSDHTLERLRNPRLPADRIFSLLAEMRMPKEHEIAVNALTLEFRSYFPKWMCLLNEGFNILLYGLGSKHQLLQSFHRDMLIATEQPVLVVNGFFPSLMVKEILDSITVEILDVGPSATNPHEAVDLIEAELLLIPQTHLYLIVHNIDGVMLRNTKAQSILARLAKVENIHLLASIDHINTPLLWDQTKLRDFNFSWWDCTTMLPYTDETAFENSLMVQNSGELALSSLRSVFSSLTTNSRGIYLLIVKYQLKNKGNPNYQGMSFKDLYWSCREAFLVSSDLALRAQLTEFLDHKLVKSKRNIDGSEQLTIPIDATLLQQFLDEQEKK